MTLHEECLLKYLLHPSDLSKSTELLKNNLNMIKSGLLNYKSFVKNNKLI